MIPAGMAAINDLIVAEVEKQDRNHPAGFPATRDGIRLCLADIEDELDEAKEAWRDGRCKCETPNCDHADWSEASAELVQVIALALRGLRSIHAREAARG